MNGAGLFLCYEWELINKRWFRFRSSRLICTFQFQLTWTEQGLGAGLSIYATAHRKRDRKKWLILKEQCALFTQLQATPSSLPHLSPTFCPTFSPTSSLPPVPAPAERLTRADEKGSPVKGQCWAATPRMPAPVQSNKAGCPPLTGCPGGKSGSFLPLILSLHWYHYATSNKGLE